MSEKSDETESTRSLRRQVIKNTINKYPDVHKKDIAAELGIDRDTLDKWLNGETALTQERCQKLIDATNAVLTREGHPLLDITSDGVPLGIEQADKVIEAARSSLQNLIEYMCPSDLVMLETIARSMYQVRHTCPMAFYECKPPEPVQDGSDTWESMTPSEQAECEQAFQVAMDNAKEELQEAYKTEELHKELEKVVEEDIQPGGVELIYRTWQDAYEVLLCLTKSQRNDYIHRWYKAWPQDKKESIEYHQLISRLYEIEQDNCDTNLSEQAETLAKEAVRSND